MVETCVVYLVWGPLGMEPVERFAASYRQHPARLEHGLVLTLKDVTRPEVREGCRALAQELSARELEVPITGLDLDSYRAVAEQIEARSLCFLNTSSEILGDGWLAALAGCLARDGVGLVGATGSFESALSSAPRPLKPLLRNRFPGFPNPHVRTNAFMLERSVMLGLEWPASRRKRRALELESGLRSITRQIQARGLDVVVVGRDGQCFDPERWSESRTFRSGEQENLLVADNRTRQYEDADPPRRGALAQMAWGESAPARA